MKEGDIILCVFCKRNKFKTYFTNPGQLKLTCGNQCSRKYTVERINRETLMTTTYPMVLNMPKLLVYGFIILFLLSLSFPLFGQDSLMVTQGDTIEFHATEVTTLEDGTPVPAGDVLRYYVHIFYEDGTWEQLIHDDLMQYPSGSNIIVEADATSKIGTHRIEAWVIRVKPPGAGGELNIPSEKTILTLTVEQSIDNRPPATWIITIHKKGG